MQHGLKTYPHDINRLIKTFELWSKSKTMYNTHYGNKRTLE